VTRLLISTAFAGLLAFSPAWGQDRDDHQDHAKPAPAAHPAPPPRPAAQPRPQMGGKFDHNLNPNGAPAARNTSTSQPQPDVRQPAPRDAMRGHEPNNPGPGTAMRGPGNNGRQGFDNAGRGTAPNNPGGGTAMRGPAAPRNFSAYQRNFNAPRHFRAPGYQRPRGWYAHRWTYGEILPALFWASDFWLNDFGDYGLEPPPPGTVWVRDGNDALLIDQVSGQIIQVDYGVFY
jgi:Ni/Co efflux regulator RcnB